MKPFRPELEKELARLRALDSEVQKRLCERSLYHFIKTTWHIIEPSIPFVGGWVVEAICEHLEAVTDGKIDRLLINVPPGFMKSLTLNVFWPAWEWGPKNKPSTRYLSAAYAEHLTARDNLKFRNIVRSPLYQKYWGDRVEPDPALQGQTKFGNKATGWKLATSVGGVGTGERGDRILIDDPNSVKEAESKAIRESTNQWFTEVVPSRVNDLKRSVIIVIQQRTHEEDVSGVILSLGLPYVHLMIPMRYDPDRHCSTIIGWEDPRTEEGELAWPARFPEEELHKLYGPMTSYAIAGQYQQIPTPRGGAIIQRDWWKKWGDDLPEGVVARYPSFSYILASLDPAYTEAQENDYSALSIWGVFEDDVPTMHGTSIIQPRVMLVYAFKDRLPLHSLVERTAKECKRFKVHDLIVEGKASGLSVIQEIKRLYSGETFTVHKVNPEGDKVARVHSISGLFENGLVYAPVKAWAESVIDEVAIFPKGAHDDMVDSMSQALKRLRDTGLLVRREEAYSDHEDEMRHRRRSSPLYPV